MRSESVSLSVCVYVCLSLSFSVSFSVVCALCILKWDCVILWMINFRSWRQCAECTEIPDACHCLEWAHTTYTATQHHMYHINADWMRCVRFGLALVLVCALFFQSLSLFRLLFLFRSFVRLLTIARSLARSLNILLLFSFTSARSGNCWLLNLIMHSLFKIVRWLSCSISFCYCCRCRCRCFVWWSFVFLQVHTKSRTNMK